MRRKTTPFQKQVGLLNRFIKLGASVSIEMLLDEEERDPCDENDTCWVRISHVSIVSGGGYRITYKEDENGTTKTRRRVVGRNSFFEISLRRGDE